MYLRKNAVIILLSVLISQPAYAGKTTDKAIDPAPLPIAEIRTFTEVFAKIKSDYVEEIDDKTLLENAIKGMLAGLDPHSTYLDKEAYLVLKEGTTGEFGGLGIEVGVENGFVKVISPIDDTPAERAGIKAGDLITRLDGKSIKGMALNEAVKLMRGKPGSDIVLTIVRQDETKPLEVTITRAIITVKSVRGELLEPGFAYIRISNFQADTTASLRQQLRQLKKDNDDPLRGLVLDLRNNPGGILDEAVSVSDLFLSRGLIVYTDGRVDNAKLKFNAKSSDILREAPIIVLVNAGSASASEIVAGALQDNERAIIMGEATFGKGSVQTILPMADQAALKLTTARYYTPSGRAIQALGIEPDIIVEPLKLDLDSDTEGNRIKEADLAGHLDSDTDENNDAAKPETVKRSALLDTDYQLNEALNLLKGLVIYSKRTG